MQLAYQYNSTQHNITHTTCPSRPTQPGVLFNIILVNVIAIMLFIIAIIFIADQVNLGHNATVCDNLTEFPQTQIESQKLVAGVQVEKSKEQIALIAF